MKQTERVDTFRKKARSVFSLSKAPITDNGVAFGIIKETFLPNSEMISKNLSSFGVRNIRHAPIKLH